MKIVIRRERKLKYRLYKIMMNFGEEIKTVKIYDMEIPKWKADELVKDKLNWCFDGDKELQKKLYIKYLGIRNEKI